MRDCGVNAPVAAVVVVYNPETERLLQQLCALKKTVSRVILVDNSDKDGFSLDAFISIENGVSLISNRENKGIGFALNQGLNRCNEEKIEFALLLDQDSIPSLNMVPELYSVMMKALEEGRKVACVGAAIFDEEIESFQPFVRFGFPKNTYFYPKPNGAGESVCVDYVITSGSLVSINALQEIGGMESDLFIDNVDFEWCFRARSLGYEVIGALNASLFHRRGKVIAPFKSWPSFQVHWHAPIRQYYIVRNRLTMYRRDYVPLIWKFRDVFRMLAKCVFYVVFISPRKDNLKMIAKGIRDAFTSRLGGLDDQGRT